MKKLGNNNEYTNAILTYNTTLLLLHRLKRKSVLEKITVQRTLDEIEITFNKTFMGRKNTHHRFIMHFSWNPTLKAIQSRQFSLIHPIQAKFG